MQRAGALAQAPAAVLFDLDGTYADTAADMGAALNALLARHGRSPLPASEIRPHVSSGARGLLGAGFGLAPDAPRYAELRAEYLALYAADICRHTRPFDGMEALTAALLAQGLCWGIVTNKPSWLTEPLLAAMAPAPPPACVVSGDTAARPKPHPDPLLHACALLDLEPARCWYVGDDARDIVAGRAAGMATLAAGWGYLGTGAPPEDWGADGIAAHPLAVLDWLRRGPRSAPAVVEPAPSPVGSA
ncbi:MAG: HAD-IA family hydrolase [Thiohalocapsa sp.]|jgi:phosphoglycolate phosphatase|uniref:HAD family hydrolase n=1 Tax=Thiohalocapsa sp. TaxID=2497641 RepID=UPI0025E670F6|nr:HAD-IA family hydrolase [Thiohalocapsa sp.]MCG6941437.1 HAD-IA family hydrolase [Thiohalocapsa sp.]